MDLIVPKGTPCKGFVKFDGYYLLLERYHDTLYVDRKETLDLAMALITPLTFGRRGIHMGYMVCGTPQVQEKAGFTYTCFYRNGWTTKDMQLAYRLENLRVFTAENYLLCTSEYTNKFKERAENE